MARLALNTIRSISPITLLDYRSGNWFKSRTIATCQQATPRWNVYLLFIAAVSMLDTYLAVGNDEIRYDEKNPVCLALIEMEPVYFTWFILAKLAGNIVVLGSLYWMLRCNYRYSHQIVFAIVGFQILLLGYLYSGHIHDYSLQGLAILSD